MVLIYKLERHDYEYECCGVRIVFMPSELLARKRMTKVTERKTKVDFAQFPRILPSTIRLHRRSRW